MLGCGAAIAQSQEMDTSLVRVDEVAFATSYEEEQFAKVLKDEGAIFELLMTVQSDMTPNNIGADRTMLSHEISKLKTVPKLTGKKKTKYYKDIYDRVHNRFLEKYELENYFSSIFTLGEYNCVSACALYGLVFEELEISFVIKETPTHVYLLIDPNDDPFVIETTDPVGGISKFSTKFKTHFVNQLKASKLISEEEARYQEVDALFDKYYFTDQNLGMKELVGVQYWNQGLYLLEDEDYHEAYTAFQKSYLLFPNEKVRDLLLGSLSYLVSQVTYSRYDESDYIIQLARFDSVKVSNQDVSNEFLRLNQKQLIDRGDVDLYTKSYTHLIEGLERASLREQITYYYNYEMARTRFNKGQSKLALEYSLAAYALKPTNIDAEGLVLSSLGRLLQYETDYKYSYNLIDSVALKYSTLMDNANFGNIYLNINLIRMEEYYRMSKRGDGDYHKDKFEQAISQYPNFRADPNLIGRAYSQLAVFHFRQGSYSAAKSALRTGLNYAPNNVELTNRLRAMR
ncbi:hypothetical protein BFP72_15380 [Reichenbachiella sp. 5M10]|nr:hypothetical protein BFP72_15380 [Reichenbachiella sp. 5M10]